MDARPNADPISPAADASVASKREVELKLSLAPEALETLLASELIVQHARNRGVTRRLDAIYYDTQERLLQRNGLSLRVRRSGKRHVQTLKRVLPGEVLARAEWEAPLPDDQLDLSLLPLAEIGEPLLGMPPERLAPVFATRIRRRLRRLDYADAQIEIAFDGGVIEAGQTSLAVSEIELELKAGQAGALYDLGLAMLEIAPLTVETRSKADRGYALAFAREPKAERARPVALGAEDNADAAIAAILGSCHAQLLGNLGPVAAGAGPEAIHQMRVSLRRLRSALSMLRREIASPALGPLGKEAKRLGHRLGPARNWDVFAVETLPAAIDDGLADTGIPVLAEAAEPLRARSHAAVADWLAQPRAARFLMSLGALIEHRAWRSDLASETMAVLAEPAGAFAQRVLARSHRKVLKRGRGFGGLGPEQRHELRLSLKTLRYLAEFVLPLFEGPPARRYLARLSRLQDALGAANDAATTRQLIGELRGREEARPELHFAAGAILGWQRCREIEAGRKLRKRWKRFAATAPFWS